MKSQSRPARRRAKGGVSAKPGKPCGQDPVLKSVVVWDLPTRLSHSAMLVLLAVQVLSGQFSVGPTAWRLWAGYLLLAVVLFRLGWGLVGSQSARFGPMIASLRGLPAYLPLLFSSRPSRWPGHNPVGSLSSLVLLLLLLISCVTGLFIETWADYRGPLAERVSRGTGLFMADLHDLVRWPLYLLVLIHVLAALAYLVFKRENRIEPIFGRGRIALEQPSNLQLAPTLLALAVLALSVVVVIAIITLGPIA